MIFKGEIAVSSSCFDVEAELHYQHAKLVQRWAQMAGVEFTRALVDRASVEPLAKTEKYERRMVTLDMV